MYVFANTAAIVGYKGQEIRLRTNSVWRADDPFVKAHPEYFFTSPEAIESSTGAVYRGVEQATAAPGEKRTSR